MSSARRILFAARRIVFAVVCLLWAGACIGISFAEAEKFRAPSLSRSVAFDVGRTVFHTWQVVQAAPAVLAILAAIASRVSRWAQGCLVLVWVALLLQNAVLLPMLEARAQTIIAGGVPAGASPHAFYAALEVLKVLALIVAAVLSLQPPRPIVRPEKRGRPS